MLKGIAMLLCSVGDIVGSIPTRSTTKNLINQSRQIQAMRQTQIEIKLTEHKRTTPIRLE
jgi:hypothetical protein